MMTFGNRAPVMQERKPARFDVLGMAITEIDQVSAVRSGMGPTAGLIVTAVRWGGAADLAGVTSGDIISEVDGRATRTLKELKQVLAAHEPLMPFRFLFRRVGTWRYLAIPFDEDRPEEKARPVAYA